tara:strand:+ start:72 stop:374 length:303 start_codon:yes stop_codon:yes gene_type:complete
MAKIEIVTNRDNTFAVQTTFREPFEYFFEIATHNARFTSRERAENLANRVRKALRENGLSRSHSFVIGREHWTYTSSAYKDRMGTDGAIYTVEGPLPAYA